MKIAIVNQKGGSGKSTTAVLLTKAFAAEKGPENKKAVLLVDADPQAGSTVLFDAKHQPNLVDAMIGNKVTEDQIIQKRIQSKKND
ncbi:MAG: AAA family ATPase, partial [Leptospiraceae bacterium]|nr:AAA family ATPase [Leptospiraceae bacterium]